MQAWDQFKKSLHKTHYYASGYWEQLFPNAYWRAKINARLAKFQHLSASEQAAILARVNYCNKLDAPFPRDTRLCDGYQLYKGKKSVAYEIDLYRMLRLFPDSVNVSYWFGDIVDVPDYPTLLKSRPIIEGSGNANSVLMKFNKIRHYYVVDDKKEFKHKIPQLVWRGKSNQPERVEVLKTFFNSRLCNVGDTHNPQHITEYARGFMSIPEQLNYRYILSVEGNDVATNTKWIMASQSVCFMRKPRFETWFMEGALIPDYHYVQIKDDYSDLEEKIDYYNAHPEEAQAIVRNANAYVNQFFNEEREELIAYLVLQKYFRLSGQI